MNLLNCLDAPHLVFLTHPSVSRVCVNLLNCLNTPHLIILSHILPVSRVYVNFVNCLSTPPDPIPSSSVSRVYVNQANCLTRHLIILFNLFIHLQGVRKLAHLFEYPHLTILSLPLHPYPGPGRSASSRSMRYPLSDCPIHLPPEFTCSSDHPISLFFICL